MSKQLINLNYPADLINIGATANDRNGDPLRTAFTKINDAVDRIDSNFSELYNAATLVVSNNSPDTPITGSLWYDTISGRPYVYYDSGWVDASPVDGAGISSTNQLVNGVHTVSLGTDGNLTVPDRITFDDGSWQSTAFIGHAYSLRNNADGSLYVTLDDSGTINTPLLLPLTFTAVLDSAHKTGAPLTLTGTPWEFTVQFQVEQDGTVQTMFDNQPWPSNPGYINGVEFEFLEADHGIPGYTFTLTLNSIQNPNPGVYTANPAVSPPPEYPATVASLGAIKLVASEATWVFGTDGQLTVPGAIFRDGGLYMNSSGSTTAASVFVSGNSGSVILRTANNAELISYDLTVDVDGETTFPGRLNFSDGSTLGDNILTGAIDSDLGLEIKRIVTVSGAHMGPNSPDVLLVDITEDDDITIVQAGWEINAGTGIAPIWLPVETVSRNENIYYLIAVSGVTFETGVTYTFRNPVPESQTWFIRNQTGGLVAPGGAIITNETAPLGEGTYRELAIELPTPDELNEHRWVFDNDGDFTTPGNITVTGGLFTTYGVVVDVAVNADNYLGLHANPNAGVLVRSSDGDLNYSDWKFEVGGALTLPNTGTVTNTSGAVVGTIHSFSADYMGATGPNTASEVYLPDNANSQEIQTGWIITFADDSTATVTAVTRVPTVHVHVEWVGSKTFSYPVTVQSADYTPAGPNTLELTPDGTTTWILDSDGKITLPSSGTISYSPAVPANWNGTPPTTIQEALDRIAAYIATTNGGTGA